MSSATPARPPSRSASNRPDSRRECHADRDFARVRVRDNGSGMKPDHKLGFGLTGMRERILALGGTLTIASDEGGVTVEALVPSGSRVNLFCKSDWRDTGSGNFPEPFGKMACRNRTFCG